MKIPFLKLYAILDLNISSTKLLRVKEIKIKLPSKTILIPNTLQYTFLTLMILKLKSIHLFSPIIHLLLLSSYTLFFAYILVQLNKTLPVLPFHLSSPFLGHLIQLINPFSIFLHVLCHFSGLFLYFLVLFIRQTECWVFPFLILNCFQLFGIFSCIVHDFKGLIQTIDQLLLLKVHRFKN
mgnify:CR=1 FL=1